MIMPSQTHQYLVSQMYNQFKTKKKITIIDYGCGSGALLDYLDHHRIQKYHGFEINEAGLQQARKNNPLVKATYTKIIPGKVPNLGINSSVDLIILVGVWQYLTDQERLDLLKKAKKVLKKDGCIILSCSVQHHLYEWLNIYRYFVPHRYVSRPELLKSLRKSGFNILIQHEKGLFIAPLFSNILAFFCDGLDYIVWRKKGSLGVFGKLARQAIHPLIALEFLVPVDFGYTLFVVAKK